MTGEPDNTIEEIRNWLSDLPSLDELRKEVGTITEAERSRLHGGKSLFAPSPEELRAYDDEFVERVLIRMQSRGLVRELPEKVSDLGDDAPSIEYTLQDHIALAEIILESNIVKLLQGQDTTEVTASLEVVLKSSVELAVAITDEGLER